MIAPELKPCPFCGGAAILSFGWVECKDCHSSSGDYSDEANAIAAWNTRATPPEVAALVEALRFYGDKNNYSEDGAPLVREHSPTCHFDGGNRARATLAAWDKRHG